MSRLKKARRRAGLTQVQLSQRSGVPQSTISELERGGGGRPQYDTLARLAKALGRRVDSLFPLPDAAVNESQEVA